MLWEQTIGRSSAVESCHAPIDTLQDDSKSAFLLPAGKPIEHPHFCESAYVPAKQMQTLSETKGARGAILLVSNIASLNKLLCSPARGRAC